MDVALYKPRDHMHSKCSVSLDNYDSSKHDMKRRERSELNNTMTLSIINSVCVGQEY